MDNIDENEVDYKSLYLASKKILDKAVVFQVDKTVIIKWDDINNMWMIYCIGHVMNNKGQWEWSCCPREGDISHLKRTRYKTVEEAIEMWEQFKENKVV